MPTALIVILLAVLLPLMALAVTAGFAPWWPM